MALEIRLMGTPAVLRDGAPVPPPRGNKAWALLAYLLLEGSAARTRLASLLFAEAEDPLAALRWNLNALRRLVGETGAFRGDPVDPRLPDGSTVDVLMLRAGSWPEALAQKGIGLEMLEGISVGASPGFESWLSAERHRVAADSATALREAAIIRLSTGDGPGAAELARSLLVMNVYDEGANELLIRALMTAGEEAAAHEHLSRITKLLRDELGAEPGPELLAACDPPVQAEPNATPQSVRAAMQAGFATVLAGQAIGLGTLRQAVEGARTLGDPELLLRSLLLLGTSLSFTDHVTSEREAVALRETLALAERVGSQGLLARAHRELAFSEYWRGHYGRAQAEAHVAIGFAQADAIETARLLTLLGCIATETGENESASRWFDAALQKIDRERWPGDLSFTLAMLGRLHLLRGSFEEAVEVLEPAWILTKSYWTTLTPWVESFLGEAALRLGDTTQAAERFEHAYALSCQTYRSNRCQILSSRGMGLLENARGDVAAAVRWLDIARTRGPQQADVFAWHRAFALEALCDIAVERHLPGAGTWMAALEASAARHGMRELLARALYHRGRLGDDEAASAARSMAAGIDNPALHRMLGC